MKKIRKEIMLLFICLFPLLICAGYNAAKAPNLMELVARISNEPAFRKSLGIKENALLKEFYESNKYKLQWFSSAADSTRRNELIQIIADANYYVLDQNFYKKSFILPEKINSKTDTLLAEIKFTDLALYFLKDIAWSHQSFVNYKKGNYEPGCIAITYLLQEGLDKNNLANSIKAAEPESEVYQRLKKMYNKILNSNPGNVNQPANVQALNKLSKAINWHRWISCMEPKNYLLINLATRKLSYIECNEQLFIGNIDAGNLPSNYTLASSIKNIKYYFDGNYPLLEFQLDDQLPISLCGYSVPITAKKHNYLIRIENSLELEKLLSPEEERGKNKVCLEEATPFVISASRFIPLFIIDVDTTFNTP